MTRIARMLLIVVIVVGLAEAGLAVGYAWLGPRALEMVRDFAPGITGPG